MAKKRAKKAKPATEANSRGGFREGAGRKPAFDEPLDATICIRVSERQKQAMREYVERAPFNIEREANGERLIDLATWLRELGLKHSGNKSLGIAAQARAKADRMKSFV